MARGGARRGAERDDDMAGAKAQEELALAPGQHRGDEPGRGGGPLVVTLGHSTRTLDEFLALLKEHEVRVLADVRAFPRSRRHPQFNIDTLPQALSAQGVGYRHLTALGGRRTVRPDSPNTAWREPGFRGFADHMDTPAFADGLEALVSLGARERVCVMCAEAQPWRCHRSLIADALVARGLAVEHIMDAGRRRPHRLPAFARLVGARVTYPAVLTE
jgi:uncharacterized protein (DUF488 family)